MLKFEKIYKLINFGAALIATVIIISVSVTVTVLVRPLYYFDIENLRIPEISGISAESCRLNYDTLIDYNLLCGESELIFPTLPMSQEAKIHFEEVKHLFIIMQVLCLMGITMLAAWWVYVRKNELKDYNHTIWMRLTGIITFSIAAVVGIAIAIDWQWAFTTMHKVLFKNNYWIFDPDTDPIIEILPDEFFMHCGILIVILTILQIVFLEWMYRRLNKCRK